MLVLTRKAKENIVIGEGPDAITIKILSTGHGMVRIGIEAPKNVCIMRQEILTRENFKAAAAPKTILPDESSDLTPAVT